MISTGPYWLLSLWAMIGANYWSITACGTGSLYCELRASPWWWSSWLFKLCGRKYNIVTVQVAQLRETGLCTLFSCIRNCSHNRIGTSEFSRLQLRPWSHVRYSRKVHNPITLLQMKVWSQWNYHKSKGIPRIPYLLCKWVSCGYYTGSTACK